VARIAKKKKKESQILRLYLQVTQIRRAAIKWLDAFEASLVHILLIGDPVHVMHQFSPVCSLLI